MNCFKKRIKKMLLVLIAFLTIGTNLNLPNKVKGASVSITAGAYTRYSVNVANGDGVHSEWNANYQAILIDGEYGFCVQPGYVLSPGTNFNPSNYNDAQKISTIAYEGWVRSNRTMEDYLATQFMIWEALGGRITSTSFSAYGSYKSAIQNRINHHDDRPSFHGTDDITLSVGESITLTDTNGVFEQYSLVNDGGLQLSKNGNTLTITATANSPENAEILYYKIPVDCIGTSVIYQKAGSQSVAKLFLKDPLRTSFNIKVNKFGKLNISKQDDLGNNVPNTSFKLSKNADMSNPIGTYTTDTSGSYLVNDLLAGMYYIQETNVPNHLLLDSAINSIEIKPNETSSYTATNKWKRGYIKVVKKDVDTGKTVVKADTTFGLYKSDGTFVQDIRTNGNGFVKTGLLLYGDYYLLEKNAPNGYIQSSEKLIYQVRENEGVYELALSNKRVVGTINLEKKDSVTGNSPQGEGTLSGAVYELRARNNILDPADSSVKFKKDELVTTLITDENAKASIGNLYLGDYYVKEKTPSYGYTLDTTEYDVSLTYVNQNVSVITKDLSVKERVIAQAFELIKVSDNGSGETDLLKGVEFTVKSQKDIDKYGSWEKSPIAKNAQGLTSDILVTDKKGYALSNEYPVGTYVVRETKVPSDHAKIPDFIVKITEDSRDPQVWRVFNDVKFRAIVSIVKKDIDNDKIITLSGAKFKIKNLDKDEYVGHWVWSPLPHYVDSWTTDTNGTVMTNDVLDAGNYQLEEVKAPDGYLINNKPIKFTITENGAFQTLPDGTTPVITIVAKDKKPTGKALLTKIDKDTKETLSGVQYQLTASEDVVDPADGSIIYKQGSTISKDISENGYYVTNELGKIEVDDLPLGSYEWKETRALDGYVRYTKEYKFELKYENDTQEVYVHEQETTNQETKVKVIKENLNSENLVGASLKLVDENDKVIKEWINKEKSLVIKGLLVGKEYTLYEETAPQGYVVAKPVKFKVENTEELQIVKMKDIQVLASKTLFDDDKQLKDTKHVVTSAKTKDIVDKWTQSDKPHAIENLIEGKEYVWTEVSAIDEVVLSSPITFTVNEKKELQTVHMIDKQVEINKYVGESEKRVIGAELQILDKETNEVVDTWNTTNEPHYASNLVEGKKYVLHEETAPKGFVKANDIEFEVSSSKKKQVINMKDIQVLASKTLFDDDKQLKGTKHVVTSTKTKDIVDKWTQGDKPHAIDNLTEGQEYVWTEVSAIDEVVVSSPITFTVNEKKELQTIHMIDKQVEINKYVTGSEERVIGAKLQILDKETNEVVDTWNTTNEPHYASNLVEGKKYVLHEETAPKGFVKANDIEFVVTKEKDTQVINMYDTKVITKVDTSDNTNVYMYAPFVLLMPLVVCVIIKIKKKDEDKKC